MGDLMNLLMQHPAIQSMLQGMQRGGGPGNTGFPPTLGGMAGGAMASPRMMGSPQNPQPGIDYPMGGGGPGNNVY